MRSAVVVGFRRCRCGRLVAGYRPVDAVGVDGLPDRLGRRIVVRDSDDVNRRLAGRLVGELVDADTIDGALGLAPRT